MAIWKRALLLLLCVVLAVSLVACGGEEEGKDKDNEKEESSKEESLNPGDENCEHEFSQWQVERTRTCEKDGKKSRECTLCGKEETMVWVATGHEFYGQGKCSVCGKRESSCKHKKAETVVIDEPTCEEGGEKRSICKSCKSVLNSEYLSSLGHEWVEHEGQEPTCTEIGWYSYSDCSRCGYTSYEERAALGHNFFAGVCETCQQSDGETGSVTVEPIKKNEYTAASGEANLLTAPGATIDVHAVTLTQSVQKAEYTLENVQAGVYRIWITELYSGNVMSIYVKNHLGEEVGSNWYCPNNEGLTVTLAEGETYTIEVSIYQGNGATFYLNVGHQTPVADLSGYTNWSGSFEFVDQTIAFTYTPEISGIHALTVSNMLSGTYARLYVYNHLGETLMDSSYLTNGNSVWGELEAGKTYYVCLAYQSKLSTVDLAIGAPKASVDVSEYNVIKDSISFHRQVNTYTFVATHSTYTFLCKGVKDDYTDMTLSVLNRLEESVCYTDYFSNDDRMVVDNLVVGETYTLCIGYSDDVTPYEVHVFTEKPATEVSGKVNVTDSIEYYDQVNTYVWTATADCDLQVYSMGMENGAVNIYIYDATGTNLLDAESYCYKGDGVYVSGVTAGETYVVRVEYCNGFSRYSVAFQY